MLRPMFSASHSAHFERKAREPENPALVRWNHQMGVPGAAFGEIWGSYVEGLGREDAYATPPDSDDEASTTTATQDPAEDEQERTGKARLRPRESYDSHGGSISSQQLDETIPRSQPPQPTTMASNTHLWISLWFLITIPVIFWDASYCFMRPRSMKGGDLHWIWKPYALYQDIDLVYGLRAYENNEGFTNAQSFLNIVENFMNIAYLYLAHVKASPVAPLLGFASIVMTLSKTILYWLQEYYCGGCSIGHNDFATLIIYWVIPNGLWIVVPGFILVQFTKDIAASLRTVDKLNRNKANSKKHT